MPWIRFPAILPMVACAAVIVFGAASSVADAQLSGGADGRENRRHLPPPPPPPPGIVPMELPGTGPSLDGPNPAQVPMPGNYGGGSDGSVGLGKGRFELPPPAPTR